MRVLTNVLGSNGRVYEVRDVVVKIRSTEAEVIVGQRLLKANVVAEAFFGQQIWVAEEEKVWEINETL